MRQVVGFLLVSLRRAWLDAETDIEWEDRGLGLALRIHPCLRTIDRFDVCAGPPANAGVVDDPGVRRGAIVRLAVRLLATVRQERVRVLVCGFYGLERLVANRVKTSIFDA